MSQRIPLDVNDNILFVSYLFYTSIVALVRLLGLGALVRKHCPRVRVSLQFGEEARYTAFS